MKKWIHLPALLLALSSLFLTSCLHILEEVTFRNDKSGTYKMTIDMSEIKTMMDAFKGMGGDSTDLAVDSTFEAPAVVEEEYAEEVQETPDSMQFVPPVLMRDEPISEDWAPPAPPDEATDPMGGLGAAMMGVAESLKGIPGITNVQEINDTSTYVFGYSFDFANVEALNNALKIINKDKYGAKADQTFKFTGKSFERLPVADIGAELVKAMTESDESSEESMEMVKMFFADMSYDQVYHFPDRAVRKSSNKLSELDPDTHTVKISIKPFDEEQQKKKPSVATKVRLK